MSRLILNLVVALGLTTTAACVRTDCANNDLSCGSGPLLWAISDCPATTSWHTFLGGALNNSTTFQSQGDGAGGYIVAGFAADDFISNPRRAFEGAAGTLNNFLVRVSPDGGIVWGTYLGTAAANGMALFVGEEGATLISDVNAAFGNPINPFQGGTDILIARVSLDGDLLWHTFQGSATADRGVGISRRTDGGFWITGALQNTAGGAAGVNLLTHPNPGVDAGFAQILDANGNAISHSFYGSATQTRFIGQAITAQNELYALGTAAGALSGAYPNTIVNHTGGGGNDGLLVKLNSAGGYLYHTFQGESTTNQRFGGGAVQSDGSIIVANSTGASYGTPLAPFTGGSLDFAISRYNADGSLQWLTFVGGAGADDIGSVGVSRNGGAWIGGSSDATFGEPIAPYVHNGGGANHSAVFGVGPNGTVGAPLFFGTAAATAGASGILETCEGGLLVTNRINGAYGARPLVPFAGGPLAGLLIRLDVALQLGTL
ncbi:MAG: delta-60 repeat domain-containing protein [Leptospirales bacterium]|jgi:hypothetical protein